MFGRIIEIKDNYVLVENTSGETETNVLNYHVVFTNNNRKTVGEIVAITQGAIEILLVGDIINDRFIAGVIKKPSFKSSCRLVYKSEVELILGKQDISKKDTLYIGKSAIYDGFNVTANANDFLSAHFAIIGNTGSGKSCGAARLIQNIFYFNDEGMPLNSHLAIFDVFGEYNNAFSKMNTLPGIKFRNYTTEISQDGNDNNTIKIPLFLLEADDIALLLNATDANQIPIIQKALELVNIFKSQGEEANSWKNDIISNAILDILTSGKNTTQMRDQIIAVLTKYNTEEVNLETPIVQPGYTRTLRQCLNIDTQGKMANVHLVVEALEKYINLNLIPLAKNELLIYTLEDLYFAFEFALISEGILKSDKVFDRNNILKVRLQSIINSKYSRLFDYSSYISLNDYVKNIFKSNNENAQIINFNFGDIDERFAKVLTKIFCKMFFVFANNLKVKTSYPIHIILEEAHRYVQNDNDINLIGYNIFDRITKEGRKYGVLLGLITQRPSELSQTAISQCSNFIVYRMYHPDDIEIIRGITSNVSDSAINKIRDSKPGSAMTFGSAFSIPLMALLELPDPMPVSRSVDIEKVWYNEDN